MFFHWFFTSMSRCRCQVVTAHEEPQMVVVLDTSLHYPGRFLKTGELRKASRLYELYAHMSLVW